MLKLTALIGVVVAILFMKSVQFVFAEKICPECHTKYPDSYGFCKKDGHKLQKIPTPRSVSKLASKSDSKPKKLSSPSQERSGEEWVLFFKDSTGNAWYYQPKSIFAADSNSVYQLLLKNNLINNNVPIWQDILKKAFGKYDYTLAYVNVNTRMDCLNKTFRNSSVSFYDNEDNVILSFKMTDGKMTTISSGSGAWELSKIICK